MASTDVLVRIDRAKAADVTAERERDRIVDSGERGPGLTDAQRHDARCPCDIPQPHRPVVATAGKHRAVGARFSLTSTSG